ncbi:uncharacterized protein P174DRAFT_435583 [Aspergillus novofumigatus IBT 16806]|uniref:Uncharacterized protein n=1 Tax=Aspergillus novofumigatus (strain IBT 16806) TaxID=1392255 RepID=A0A2I1BU20_ASPN1|nr:uncharacterized protein P174DRAFT_435583 [Aspergillus novofumigatus IBT 16806]PKX88856.1 hypothetical protein P174DRAFT_435583 [Aspergillus novofumigatus IBT 16806]
MDILSTLRLLQKARTEDLQSYHDEVLLMLADMSKRLKSDNSSISDSRGEYISIGSRYSVTSDGSAQSSDEEASDSKNSITTSHNTPLSGQLFSDGLEKETGPTDPSTRDSKPPQDPVLSPKIPTSWPNKLFKSFADTLQWLYTFSRDRPGDIIKAQRMEKRDRRIEDIQHVEGSKLARKSNQFFKGMAQRSMGLKYTNYQLAAGEPTRVSELCEGVRYSDSRLIKKRPGIAKRYLTSTELKSDEKETILRGINVGVKQLVLKELFRRQLQESRRSNLPGAISAFTALNANAFIHLHFKDFPQFIDLILPPKPEAEIPRIQLSTGPNSLKSFQIPDVLVSLSKWFSEFQIAYNGKIPGSLNLYNSSNNVSRHILFYIT